MALEFAGGVIVGYLIWGRKIIPIIAPPEAPEISEMAMYDLLKRAWIDAYYEAERSLELLSVEESITSSKVYDLESGVVAQDGNKYRFDAKDLNIRSDQTVTVLINNDPKSKFTVEVNVPYTNSALRRIRQVTITPTVSTNVKLQFAGKFLEMVK